MKRSVEIIIMYISVIVAVAAALNAIEAAAFPDAAHAAAFSPAPKDRPVLETVQQVREARITGTATFKFDGVRYVISGIPKEYVDYSAWCVRMP